MKKIITCLFVIAEFSLTYIIEKVYDITIDGVSLVFLIGIPTIILTLLIGLFYDYSLLKKREKDKDKQINELKSKITNFNTFGTDPNKDKGTRLMLMALCQSNTEPLKHKLLDEATFKYRNLIAGLLLANTYKIGVKKNNNLIVSPDRKKAFDIYIFLEPFDMIGVSEWELGWIYENDLLELTHHLSESERKKTACEYYQKSAMKGFAKAFNSLGKFYYNGWGGLEYNYHEAEKCYSKASELDDVYAIMNYGLLSMRRYYDHNPEKDLSEAESYFKKATQYDNAEGYLHLGIINEIRSNHDPKLLEDAVDNYLKSINTVDNQYSATAYFKLGKLINKYEKLKKDKRIINILGNVLSENFSIECFNRAYDIFHRIEEENGRLDGDYVGYYDELKDHFYNI